MKFLSAFVLCPLLSVAALADAPAGFADIPFGASVKDAKKTLSERDGVKAGKATEDRVTFSGGTFAEQPVSQWTLNFAGGKLASGSVLIEDVKKSVYDELKGQLTKKYGKPDSEKGHHSWDCTWEFRSDGRRTVLLQYEHQGRVVLTYSHGGLAKSAPAKAKSDL